MRDNNIMAVTITWVIADPAGDLKKDMAHSAYRQVATTVGQYTDIGFTLVSLTSSGAKGVVHVVASLVQEEHSND